MNFIVIKTKSLLILLDSLAFPYSSFFAVRYNIIRPFTHTHTRTELYTSCMQLYWPQSLALLSTVETHSARSRSLSLSPLLQFTLSLPLNRVCDCVCLWREKKRPVKSADPSLSPSLPSSNSSSKLFLFYF